MFLRKNQVFEPVTPVILKNRLPNRGGRPAKDLECLNRSGLAFLHWGSVRLLVKTLPDQQMILDEL
jgi:hypothetical protein